MKICKKCGTEKELNMFTKNMRNDKCKKCISEYNKECYIDKDRQYILIFNKHFKEEIKEYNSLLMSIYYKDYRENPNNKIKKSINDKKSKDKNKIYFKEKSLIYYKENKYKIIAYQKEYKSNRKKYDPTYKLYFNVSSLIRNSFKYVNHRKNSKTADILGCPIKDFKIYLEKQFINDMSWTNHGTYWDIDHIIPISTALNEADIIRLNHYTNLQPLDSFINRYVKRDRLDY